MITTVGTAGATGTGLTLASPLANAHAAGSMVALAGPGSTGEGTSTTSCSNAWSTLGANSPIGRTLSTASTFYQGHYQGNVPVATTNAGYIDQGMQNRQFPSGVVGTAGASTPLSGGEYYAVKVTDTTPATAPRELALRILARERRQHRRGRSRGRQGYGHRVRQRPGRAGRLRPDLARRRHRPVPGETDQRRRCGEPEHGRRSCSRPTRTPSSDVAAEREGAAGGLEQRPGGRRRDGPSAARPGQPERPHGDDVAGRPGPTRSGATTRRRPLYPGDTLGTHPERLNGAAGGASSETEGIYTGYRFFDKEGITPQFPFGFGMSYSDFSMPSNWSWGSPAVTPTADGGLDVKVRVRNGNSVPGTEVGAGVRRAAGQPGSGRAVRRALARAVRPRLGSGDKRRQAVDERHAAHRAALALALVAERPALVRDSGTRTIFVGDADATDHLMSTTANVPATPGSAGFECNNVQIDATKIDGDVNVPAGAWCDLIGRHDHRHRSRPR